MVDFRGNLLDFQINEYGNRHDAVFWPYHQNAMGWLPWEYGLADSMAYELCPNILTQFVWRECLTHTQMLYNAVLGFYRSRVEAVVADVVNNKGLFSHPWAGNMPFLKALMTIEVHATQLHRRMFGGTRYNEVSGSYGHREFSGNENKEGACCSELFPGDAKGLSRIGTSLLGKSSVAARESPIGEYALPPPEILIGEYSAREILIGDRYWGLLGTIGECPEISGAPKSLLGNTVCGWQNAG